MRRAAARLLYSLASVGAGATAVPVSSSMAYEQTM